MPKQHTHSIEQFRSFCFQNKATDIEKAIEYFSRFRRNRVEVDMTKPLDELIKERIFVNYRLYSRRHHKNNPKQQNIPCTTYGARYRR